MLITYFKKSDEDRFDDDDFDNDFDFDEEEKDLSGGKERSYVPLRFSTVKSEEETAAEEAKEECTGRTWQARRNLL